MQGKFEYLLNRRDLHNFARVHHRHRIGEVFHHVEIMGNEQHGEIEFALKLAKKIEHLRLHRNVERRNRLIGDEQLGARRQGAGDADPSGAGRR